MATETNDVYSVEMAAEVRPHPRVTAAHGSAVHWVCVTNRSAQWYEATVEGGCEDPLCFHDDDGHGWAREQVELRPQASFGGATHHNFERSLHAQPGARPGVETYPVRTKVAITRIVTEEGPDGPEQYDVISGRALTVQCRVDP